MAAKRRARRQGGRPRAALPQDSFGAQRLREALDDPRERLTQGRVAEICGVTQQAVSKWVGALGRPEVESMLAMQRVLGIPLEAWLAPPRKKTGTDG